MGPSGGKGWGGVGGRLRGPSAGGLGRTLRNPGAGEKGEQIKLPFAPYGSSPVVTAKPKPKTNHLGYSRELLFLKHWPRVLSMWGT